jgi:hypothetical protein
MNDFVKACATVFAQLNGAAAEGANVYSVTEGDKKFYFAVCENINIPPESVDELGLKDFRLIKEDHRGREPYVWSVRDLLSYYANKKHNLRRWQNS